MDYNKLNINSILTRGLSLGLGGIGVGIVVAIGWRIVSGSSVDVLLLMFVGAIAGFIAGIFVEVQGQKEAMIDLEKEERNARIMQRFQEWEKNLMNLIFAIHDKFKAIEKEKEDLDYDFENLYQQIWEIEKKLSGEYPIYRETFDKNMNLHKQSLRNLIYLHMAKKTGRWDISIALSALKALKMANNNDNRFDAAIQVLDDFDCESFADTNYIIFEGYGRVNFPLDDPDEMEYITKHLSVICKEKVIQPIRNLISAKEYDEYYNILVENLSGDLLENAACVMWYYAKKDPFDIEGFNKSIMLYNKYADVSSGNESESLTAKVEVILATIYYKNKMGGINLVRQDQDYINQWIHNKLENKWEDSVCMLASGLAWMGLYDLERDVLRKLVEQNVSLDAELQDRLRFLESGGTTDIPIYESNNSGAFEFDNSSDLWKQKEFDIFFRQLDMKGKVLEYSLVLEKWNKTFPLSKGQKISEKEIYQEFLSMVEDFDGEVTCKRTDARAVNLDNLQYERAVLFEFNSNRNRCLSVLYAGEKYGRNLNITILTLFTPEEGLSNEEMKKYALAILSNIYVESFRESILQSLDFVLKEKKSIYGGEIVNNNNIFE